MSRSQIRRPTGAPGLGADDRGCTILHVDMDAFYASVELLDHPHLVGTPVIVGGHGTRGVVLSATYEARALGIHSAMPMSRARRIAPRATVLEPRHALYSEVSRAVMEIFGSITPLVEPLSLDEAFLDVAGALRRLGSPTRIGELIRSRVEAEQGITCSVGVASTKFVAKLASTRAKPNGLLVVPREEVLAFLHPLPVSALWGVGAKTEEALDRLGLKTVADLAHTPVETLQRALGPAAGAHLADLAWGRDPRSVTPDVAERSMGAEETFARDVDDPEVIRREFLRLSHTVARRLRAQGLVGRTVSIKVRMSDFSTLTRSRTLSEPTDVAREVFEAAMALYSALGLQRVRIRLVGVRLEGLVAADGTVRQMALDLPGAPTGPEWRAAEQATDRLRAKYGHSVVQPARLVQDSQD